MSENEYRQTSGERASGVVFAERRWLSGELAQLGERLLCTQEVSGSIPLFSTSPEDKRSNTSTLKEYLY